jgi:hypothetical protein
MSAARLRDLVESIIPQLTVHDEPLMIIVVTRDTKQGRGRVLLATELNDVESIARVAVLVTDTFKHTIDSIIHNEPSQGMLFPVSAEHVQ